MSDRSNLSDVCIVDAILRRIPGQSLTAEQIVLLDAVVVGGSGVAMLLPTVRRALACLLGTSGAATPTGEQAVAAAGGIFATYAAAVAVGVQIGQTRRVLPLVVGLNGVWVAASKLLVLLALVGRGRAPWQPADRRALPLVTAVAALVAWFAAVQLRLLRQADRA